MFGHEGTTRAGANRSSTFEAHTGGVAASHSHKLRCIQQLTNFEDAVLYSVGTTGCTEI